MFKHALAIFAIIFGLAIVTSPASAQYGAGVATGGTMALRQGVPHAQTVYEDQCRRIGAYNHPMCMTGRHGAGGYGQRYYGGRRYYVAPPRYYGERRYYGARTVIAPAGAYQAGLIRRFGGSIEPRGGARPVPSPEQIAAMVPHKRTRTPVPCIDGYVKNEANGQCDLVSWTPGPDPE